jgi:hypothetical protein
MCYNCGCFNPQDDMGNSDNITEATLKKLAGQEDLNAFKARLLDQLNQNQLDSTLEAEFAKAAKAWGQSVDEAKKNAKDLLKTEVK